MLSYIWVRENPVWHVVCDIILAFVNWHSFYFLETHRCSERRVSDTMEVEHPYGNGPLALVILSSISIGIGAVASLWITFDIVSRKGWRTMMGIMYDL